MKANNNFPQNNQQQEQFYQQRLYNPQQQRKSGSQQFLGQNQYSQFTPNQQQYPQLTQQQLRAQHQQQQNVRSQHQQTFVQQPNWLHNQNYGNKLLNYTCIKMIRKVVYFDQQSIINKPLISMVSTYHLLVLRI